MQNLTEEIISDLETQARQNGEAERSIVKCEGGGKLWLINTLTNGWRYTTRAECVEIIASECS